MVWKVKKYIVAIVILIFILLIFIGTQFDGNRLLPNYPYAPNTWGNIADWFTVVITLLTVLFVGITLKSQLEVQKSQEKMQKLESKKYIESIRPLFSFRFVNSVGSTHTIAVKCNVSISKSIRVHYQNRQNYYHFINRFHNINPGWYTLTKNYMLPGEEFQLQVNITHPVATGRVQFILVYFDNVDTGYVQQVDYDFTDVIFIPGIPKNYDHSSYVIQLENLQNSLI